MRTYPLLCLLILISTSCSLFQHTTKKQREKLYKASSSLAVNTTAKTNTVKHTEQLKTQKDTALADYYMRFWPKGNLTFLPSGGFSGEFDSIQLKGKLQVMRNSTASVLTNEQKNEIKHKKLQADQDEHFSSNDISKTSAMDLKLLIFVAFILLAGLFFWLRKMNFKRK